MRRFGLIGYPLTHSFSPGYFAQKFADENIRDCKYELFPIQSINELPQLLQQQRDLQGLNVTIPYKKEVVAFLDTLSEEVQKMSACNCIKVQGGKLTGFNTDVTGFELSLVPLLKPQHQKALVLGTGGSASAIKFVLDKLKIDFLFVSRGNTKKEKNCIVYSEITPQLLMEYTIIINSTPLGMYPNVEECPPIPYHHLTNRHYLFDLIYNPDETLFLKKGKEQGATVKNGSDMLVIQADESWRIWNDPLI